MQRVESRWWMCGRLTIADFGLIPYATLAESCGLDLSRHPNAHAWMKRMVARDSVKRTMAAAASAAA